MTNGCIQYNKSERSRSCENSLDSCGQRSSDELIISSSSSSLVDLPISPTSHADYDNLTISNGNRDVNRHQLPPTLSSTAMQQSLTRITTQSPISSELDKKTKDAIDARLKAIDDEFELNRKVHVSLFFFSFCFIYIYIYIYTNEKKVNLSNRVRS